MSDIDEHIQYIEMHLQFISFAYKIYRQIRSGDVDCGAESSECCLHINVGMAVSSGHEFHSIVPMNFTWSSVPINTFQIVCAIFSVRENN